MGISYFLLFPSTTFLLSNKSQSPPLKDPSSTLLPIYQPVTSKYPTLMSHSSTPTQLHQRCVFVEGVLKKTSKRAKVPPFVESVPLCYTVFPHHQQKYLSKSSLPANFSSTPSRGIELITHLRWEDRQDLVLILKNWSGPLTCVLFMDHVLFETKNHSSGNYAPTNTSSPHLHSLFEWFEQLPAKISTSSHLLWQRLVIHTVHPEHSHYKSIYPINLLRNVGIFFSRESLLFIMDSDTIPSRNMFEDLKHPNFYPNFFSSTQRNHIFTLPVFTFCNQSYAQKSSLQIPFSKSTLLPFLSSINSSLDCRFSIKPFHRYQANKFSQSPLQIDSKWIHSTKPYYINYSVLFEAPFIAHKHLCPWFDESFLDQQGLDLQIMLATLDISNFQFVTLSNHFLFLQRNLLENSLDPSTTSSPRPTFFAKQQYGELVKNLYVSKIQQLISRKLEINHFCETIAKLRKFDQSVSLGNHSFPIHKTRYKLDSNYRSLCVPESYQFVF
eukprot:Sdes_comp11285_c0_seq1m2736